ncbi:MAG: hypothetical protein PHQ95_01310 [Candidatus Gracilibacteria bacterium]|nr:hypothetical protein [Candidatus Gracilibacteria bacterium]
MNRDKALELLELPESTELSSIQSHYRLLRSKGHPDSAKFDGVVRNLAKIREAYDFLMGNKQKSGEGFASKKKSGNAEFDKFRDDINNWFEGFLARERKKKDILIALVEQYGLSDIMNDEDLFIKLLVNEFDEPFFEALYMTGSSLDKEFEIHFQRIKGVCFKQGLDFNKFVYFFEDHCIPHLLSELAFKYTMDSGNGIGFFAGWGEDILYSYESSRSLIRIIDDNPNLFGLYPYFISEIRKYYQRIPDKKQSEFIF